MKIVDSEAKSFNIEESPELKADGELVSIIRTLLKDVDIVDSKKAIQADLAKEIIEVLKKSKLKLLDSNESIKCCNQFNYKYDGLIKYNSIKIGVEVQFRPDFLKDITRFQIGFNSGRIDAIIYIVTHKIDSINPSYKAMPRYDLITKQLEVFAVWIKVPIIVIGITGNRL